MVLVLPARAYAKTMKEGKPSDRRSRENKKARVWQDPGFPLSKSLLRCSRTQYMTGSTSVKGCLGTISPEICAELSKSDVASQEPENAD